MSSNVESMAYYGSLPWHGLGTKLDPSRITEAQYVLQEAGLSWRVDLHPAGAVIMNSGAPVDFTLAYGYRAVVRATDNQTFSIVRDKYRVLQNLEAFDFLDSLARNHVVEYHTAGSLDGGKKVWVLVKIPGDIRVTESDIIERYLLFINSHDGKSSLKMMFTPVRVVCQNTLNFALKHDDVAVEIRHTGDIRNKLQLAKSALGFGEKGYSRLEESARRMVEYKVTEKEVDAILAQAFPTAFGDSDESNANNKAKDEILSGISLIVQGMTKTNIPGQEGSLWRTYNAVTELIDHLSKSNESRDARFNRILLGPGALAKKRAYEASCALVKV